MISKSYNPSTQCVEAGGSEVLIFLFLFKILCSKQVFQQCGIIDLEDLASELYFRLLTLIMCMCIYLAGEGGMYI